MSEEKIKYYAKEFMYTDTKEIQILQPYIMIEIINLLQQENKELKHQLEEEKNIRNKAIEYVKNMDDNENSYGDYEIHYECKKELLQILQNKE